LQLSAVRGGKVEKRLILTSFLFLPSCKTLAILNKACMGSVKVVVATLPFSKTSFSEKMQPRVFGQSATFMNRHSVYRMIWIQISLKGTIPIFVAKSGNTTSNYWRAVVGYG